MSDTVDRRAGPATVGHRLQRARHRWFLGREEELALFRSALAAPEPPFAVLFVHGPGGVGKTALLRAFTDEASAAGALPIALDARHLEPSPPGFTAAVCAAAGLEPGRDLGTALAGTGRRVVVLLDTYELAAAALDDWLREGFLPTLPGDSVLVLAGREPPGPGWRSEAAWRELLRVVALGNLGPDDTRAYLRAAGVPAALHERVLGFTRGHPLALSLLVDVLAQDGADALAAPEHAPDVLRVLLTRFVAGIPGERHRRALEVCAHARLTTEALLRAALATDDVHDVFEWLRGLSFIEQGPHGLAPHDLAREVFDADLRWRDRERYGAQHERIRAHVLARARATHGLEQQRALLDFMFLHRHHPFTQPYWDWASFGQAWAEPATPADHDDIVALVRRYEGEASADAAAHWLARQPAAFTAFRGPGGDFLGFVAILDLTAASAEDIDADPVTRASWAWTRDHVPPRPGEVVTHQRFTMARDTYQRASPAMNLVSVQATRGWITTPGLAWNFVSVGDEAYWGPLFAYLYFDRVPEADVELGGHRTVTFAHDWRRLPPAPWLDRMAERELDFEFRPPATPPAVTTEPAALARPEFERAVRRALRELHRHDLLADNPLVRSRLVRARAEATGETPARALADLVREAAALLAADPRDDKLLRAVDRTYLRPAPTQERAAELLGLPFSTYRRHLTRGVARIAAGLWEREVHGDAGQP